MVYRITIQQVNADGSLGELVEILETERASWTSVFDFVDSYRAEMAKDVVFLYNGTLLYEDGECALPIPRLFHSIEDAQSWVNANEFSLRVVKGTRKGDVLVSKEHVKVIHGLCSICGHYGDDCTGLPA